MKTPYILGFLFCTILGVTLIAWLFRYSDNGEGNDSRKQIQKVVFIPEIVDLTAKPLLRGETRIFSVRMKNISRDNIALDRLEFSCPCAGIDDQDQRLFPYSLAPGNEVEVRILVKASLPGSGRLQLRMAAYERSEEEKALGVGLAEIDFLERINADPGLLSLKTIQKSKGSLTEEVRLWHPLSVSAPKWCKAECSDPSITATIKKKAEKKAGRCYFGTLVVTIDSRKARSRFHENIVLKSDVGEVLVPVLGFVED